VRATEEAPAATDLAVIEEALERVGVEHRNLSGISERTLLLAGGTVLRFDQSGSYLGASGTGGDHAPATQADVSVVEGDRESTPESYPIYIGGDAGADDTTALLPTRRGSARRGEGSPPVADGVRDDLERLARLMPAGGPLVVEEELSSGVIRNFSGAGSDLRLVELWLSRKSEASRRAYLADLEKFFDVVGDHHGVPRALREITLSDLHEFAASISEMFAPRSQVRMLATVKSLFSYAQKTGYLPHNVGAALELPGVKDDLAERELSETEVLKMIAGENNRRDRVMLLTLYAGGLRREDVCALKWRDVKARDDVAPGAGQITVHGKGGKTGNVLLPPAVFREILSLRSPEDGAGNGTTPARHHSPDAPVFPSRKRKTARSGHLDPSQVNRIVRKAARSAGIREPISPHWLRHSHATHASRRGADLALIRDTLRHASIATTGRYLHANPSKSSAMYLSL
jgi:site-specific recombinase XerD